MYRKLSLSACCLVLAKLNNVLSLSFNKNPTIIKSAIEVELSSEKLTFPPLVMIQR